MAGRQKKRDSFVALLAVGDRGQTTAEPDLEAATPQNSKPAKKNALLGEIGPKPKSTRRENLKIISSLINQG